MIFAYIKREFIGRGNRALTKLTKYNFADKANEVGIIILDFNALNA